ncbi:hypothetical protein [Lentibacillus persicus]|uniref:hypothetical protein n=1 Tax=Lentibacillus persicus TaxID=640948 RepID=UPI001C434CB0|nr:hypothetical protein [Lentibacillus persicus]
MRVRYVPEDKKMGGKKKVCAGERSTCGIKKPLDEILASRQPIGMRSTGVHAAGIYLKG